MTPNSPTGRSSSTRSPKPVSAPSNSDPIGYLPTEPERLKDELGKRGLTLTGGTVGTATHRGREAFEQSRRDAFAICELLAAMDVHYLVALPEMYTDLHTGALTQPVDLTAEQWGDLVDGLVPNWAGSSMSEYDVAVGFHPHVDTHVDTQHIHRQVPRTTPIPARCPCAWTRGTSSTARATTARS